MMGKVLHLRSRHLNMQWSLLYETVVRFNTRKIRGGKYNTWLLKSVLYERTEFHEANPKWMPYSHLELFEGLSSNINAALEKDFHHVTRHPVPFFSEISHETVLKQSKRILQPLSVSLAATRTPGISPI
jgi:hypothetical protein